MKSYIAPGGGKEVVIGVIARESDQSDVASRNLEAVVETQVQLVRDVVRDAMASPIPKKGRKCIGINLESLELKCGKDIPQIRLQSWPVARRCKTCEELYEKELARLQSRRSHK